MKLTHLLQLVAAILLTIAAIGMLLRARSGRPTTGDPSRNKPGYALIAGVLFALAAAVNWVLYFTNSHS